MSVMMRISCMLNWAMMYDTWMKKSRIYGVKVFFVMCRGCRGKCARYNRNCMPLSSREITNLNQKKSILCLQISRRCWKQ